MRAVATVEKKNDVIEVTAEQLEIVEKAQGTMQTLCNDPRVLINQVASTIALPKDGGVVTAADVLTVIRTASSMGLDPMLGGIWSFKDKNGRMMCGVTKKGWQQALHKQPSYCGMDFIHEGGLQPKKVTVTGKGQLTIYYYPVSICIIKKKLADGSIGEFKGIAYFDEEFSGKETWIDRPKRMLDTRALTIAAANAYGWGAADADELKDFLEPASSSKTVQSPKHKGAERVIEALETTASKTDEEKQELISQMRGALTHEELVKIFKDAPEHLQKDKEIIELGKALVQKFETNEEDL